MQCRGRKPAHLQGCLALRLSANHELAAERKAYAFSKPHCALHVADMSQAEVGWADPFLLVLTSTI